MFPGAGKPFRSRSLAGASGTHSRRPRTERFHGPSTGAVPRIAERRWAGGGKRGPNEMADALRTGHGVDPAIIRAEPWFPNAGHHGDTSCKRNVVPRTPESERREGPTSPQARQTSLEFKPTGRGGARPGAGRPRKRRARVPHRRRGAIPGRCPVLVTLRVLDDVPALRRGRFVRAFRRRCARAGTAPVSVLRTTRFRTTRRTSGSRRRGRGGWGTA